LQEGGEKTYRGGEGKRKKRGLDYGLREFLFLPEMGRK